MGGWWVFLCRALLGCWLVCDRESSLSDVVLLVCTFCAAIASGDPHGKATYCFCAIAPGRVRVFCTSSLLVAGLPLCRHLTMAFGRDPRGDEMLGAAISAVHRARC